MRRAAFVLLLLHLVLPAPAAAAGPTAALIKLSPAVGPPTTTVAVKGKGFAPNEGIRLAFDDVGVRQALADGSGRFTSRIRVPRSALPGEHTIAATGEQSGRTAQATFTVRTDWTRFHFNAANTGFNPYENVLDPGNVGDVVPKWITPSLGSEVYTSPAVADGVVYFSVGGGSNRPTTFYALDAETGAVNWSRDLDPYYFPTDPTVVDGTVYVAAREALFALNANTGGILWTLTASYTIETTPAVADGVVYFASILDLYAADAATGDIIWTVPLDAGLSSPALAGGLLYIGSRDLNLHAFDASTGEEVWAAPTGGYVTDSSPAVSGGVVYVGSTDDKLHAFDASTGTELWAFRTGDDVNSSPAVADGVVFVGSDDTKVYSLDADNGTELWEVPTGDQMFLASPSVANGVVYTGSKDQTMYAIDAVTGEVLWTYVTGGGINFAPAVADGVLYTGSFDYKFYAFALP